MTNASYLREKNKSRSTERRHKIIVLRVDYTTASGIVTENITEQGPYWASVKPLSEKARTQYQAISVDASHVIGLDGRIDIRESDKIKFEDRVFDVLTIKRVDERFRDKTVITQEIRPGGKI